MADVSGGVKHLGGLGPRDAFDSPTTPGWVEEGAGGGVDLQLQVQLSQCIGEETADDGFFFFRNAVAQ